MQSTSTANTAAIAERFAAVQVGVARDYLAAATARFRDETAGMIRFHHLPQDRQRALCHHEAGHVIMNLAMEIPFRSVSVRPRASEEALGIVRTGAKSYRPSKTREVVKECYTLLAGGCAEELATGQRNVAAESDDVRQALRLLPGLSVTEQVHVLEGFRPAVKAVLEERWDQVQAVASALLRQGELDEETARQFADDADLHARTARVCADIKAYLAAQRAR